ncbi:MAG: alpha/beta fold hydrolase [Myxococcales bacterium]|nr:alpha/beta fold hydrolase [Myxococcales bacterium]
MPRVDAHGIQLEYDTFGDRSGRPLLLIMGLGGQMIMWDEGFCEALAADIHFVVRFDNRDIGLSTHFDEHGLPDLAELMIAFESGTPATSPYSLDDMADDTAGLLEALELESAHVCGASMGGMIAQTVAIRHPERVKSLVSIMSTTGEPGLPGPTAEAMQVLISPPPTNREEAIERGVKTWSIIGSPGFPFDEARTRERAAAFFDRAHHPQGQVRQLAAIVAHGSRRPALRELSVPTLVIHGDSDPLVPIEGGRDTAAAVPGAEFLVIEGMAHDLPPGAWPTIVPAIARHTQAAA